MLTFRSRRTSISVEIDLFLDSWKKEVCHKFNFVKANFILFILKLSNRDI